MRKVSRYIPLTARMHILARTSEIRGHDLPVTSVARLIFCWRVASHDILVAIGMIGAFIFHVDGKLLSVGLYKLLE
jgi:hypothetical protein